MYEVLDATYDLPTIGAGGILLLGTSTDGPTMVPRRLYDIRDVKNIFGSGEIIPAFKEVATTGASDIYAMRISGTPASAYLYTRRHASFLNRTMANRAPFNRIFSGPGDANTPAIAVKTVPSGAKYNDYSITVGQVSLTINNNEGVIALYHLWEFSTLRKLCERINRDTLIHGISTIALEPNALPFQLSLGDVALSGGTDGIDLTPQERQEFLNTAYSFVEDIFLDVDVIVPLSTAVDNEVDYCGDLSKLCAKRTAHGYGTIGVMGFKDINAESLLNIEPPQYREHITAIAARPIYYIEDMPTEGLNLLDDLRYVSNGVCGYAGLISGRPVNQSVMKKSIRCNDAFDNFTEEQRIALTNKGITTIRPTFGGWCITKGVTMQPNSVFDNVDNMRLVSYVQRFIRASFDDYIGNNVIETIDAQREIDAFLRRLINEEAIRSYSFSVQLNRHDMYIQMELVPIYGIATISTSLRLLIRM